MIRRVLLDSRGGGAVEFALVLHLLIVFLFGIIDVGRFAWQVNQMEKATQAGARVAVVTQVIPQGLADFSYVGQTIGGVTYTQGDVIQASALGTVTCQKTAGTLGCTGSGQYPALGTINAAGFDAIVARMQQMYPGVTGANVIVEYRGSGLGFAGDPSGMDVSPLVTVKLSGLSFTPISGLMLASIALPTYATTLTAEDSAGSQSN